MGFGSNGLPRAGVAAVLALSLLFPGCIQPARLEFSDSGLSGDLKTDAQIRALTSLEDRIFHAWRSRLRPIQLAQCASCHAGPNIREDLRHAVLDEEQAFAVTSALIRLGEPVGSKMVNAFGPVIDAHSAFSDPASIKQSILTAIQQIADLAGVPQSSQPATAPYLLNQVPAIPPNPSQIADTVVDLTPLLSTTPGQSPAFGPKLFFKVGMHDDYAYRIYSVRIGYSPDTASQDLKPLQVKALRIRMDGNLIPSASTFATVDALFEFTTSNRTRAISTAALILPHACPQGAPCGEALSFSFDHLAIGGE